MVQTLSVESLDSLLAGDSQFALIDVREAGEYNSSHIPSSSSIPRRALEATIGQAAPHRDTHVVVCDDDGRRARLAGASLEALGYRHVSVLEAGINRWASRDYPTEWGSNVPSKEFGEKMEVVNHVPEIDAEDLHQRMERGEKMVILDTRTPEEYQRFCIPGGRSVPGGELAFRITDIKKDLDSDTTVIINCAGRTRSIIGTRVLQRMGLTNIFGLKNGTSGWVLAGYELEPGGDRLDLPRPSPEGLAAAEAYADTLAHEDGVRYLDPAGLQEVMARRDSESVYLIDVRTEQEYREGHIPGFRWFPGGQAVQRSDDVAVVKNTAIVFACDGKVRSTVAASWYRQLGVQEVYAVAGGTTAWSAAGHPLEKETVEEEALGLAEARSRVPLVSARELDGSPPPVTIFVDTSQDFSRGHVSGAHWVPRGWLEIQISGFAPDKTTNIAVTANDTANAVLAAATLQSQGYQNVSALDGGMAAWRRAGLAVETGLSGVMGSPNDLVASGPDRNYADMMNYLRWETALGEKYES